jgi:biotin carboxyl carrier protein
VTVYGGSAALSHDVARAAWRAAEDGPDGPRIRATQPAAASLVDALPGVSVELDRPVHLAASSLYVEVGGTELRGTVEQPADGRLELRPAPGQAPPAVDVTHPVRVSLRVQDTNGRSAHHQVAFTYRRADPVFASAGPVALHLPSPNVELIGYHQANHPGAQQQQPRGTATPQITLPSRQRGTGSRTSADVVADPGRPVLAPVSGRVLRAGSYVLYCRYTDHYAVIEPDTRPGWEVKVLHFHGVRVRPGDRVVAGETVLGAGPRHLPFKSQVDDYSHPRNWPHLHLEVVDPSVPARPGSGC